MASTPPFSSSPFWKVIYAMALFFLTRNPSPLHKIHTLESHLTTQGFVQAQSLITPEYRLAFFYKLIHSQQPDSPLFPSFISMGDDQFIGVCGCFFFDDSVGVSALKGCFTAFEEGHLDWNRTRGQFTLVIQKGGTLFLASDTLGASKIYHNEDQTLFSNSFQVLFDLLPHGESDPQGCYEYAWNGTTFGQKTFIKQIKTLSFDRTIKLDDRVRFPKRENLCDWQPPGRPLSFEETVHQQLDKLRPLFATYRDCFGDRINTALSGGYDSRLILALFLDAGVVPDLFVYGSETDGDVTVAKQIAQGEGLPLKVIDKSRLANLTPDGFAEQLEKNWYLFDGWKSDGLLDSGVDGADRVSRASNHLVVNGGLGEIYRNFFYLPDRPLTIEQLVWSFFSRYDPKTCTDAFSPTDYGQHLTTALTHALGRGADWLHRGRIEMAYPLFRGRYWTARESALNSRIGWAAFPFLEPTLIRDSWHIPLTYKEQGRLEARMIQQLNPRLAHYHSIYGHRLSTAPPLKQRWAYWSSSHRPIGLRGYLYRLKFSRPKNRPFYLQETFLNEVLDLSFPRMSRYFHREKINDPDLFNRVATMEYALARRGWA
ncbi:MAG: hypothetical protein HQL72_05295 [Magnetococcales bacterium]|nr:hypothetical protein [Magnetococcales bacterium]